MDAFDKIGFATPKSTQKYVSRNLELVERIYEVLERQNKTQKDLALALGKSPSEISRWLSGLHNFSLKTIARIEEALGEDLIDVQQGEMPRAASATMLRHANFPTSAT